MKRSSAWHLRLSLIGSLAFLIWGQVAANSSALTPRAYLPLVSKEYPPVEVRALWVSRFDWTTYNQPAQPAKIDEIVQNAAAANFNVIFFQVRGSADAYYAPGLEPWAQRVSGKQVGTAPDPWWDPLEYFVNAAHAHDIQLHAYFNVYPVWDSCTTAPPITTPTHFYYLLQSEYGTTDGKLNGLQWDTGDHIYCNPYLLASPASIFADTHFLEVARYLVTEYAIDGIHLDNVRYGYSNTSCDPVSEYRYGAPCFSSPDDYAAWQRVQVNGTVAKFYDQIVPLKAGLWLSAAVWPDYLTGFHSYYQDSKAWVKGGYIDSILPMIYSGTQADWQTRVTDFQNDRGGRFIIPGISASYSDFGEIRDRINIGRAIGTAGHAIFSYGGLNSHGYWDDFVAPGGPHEKPALVPTLPWR
jgi:uncharacterized lipoprotein YddW (UPF0748 family)